MSKRFKMRKGRSKSLFSRTASRVHPKNGMGPIVMRGGIRL